MYLKNRIIFFFLFLYFVLSFIFFLPFSSYQSISFCFRWFRFAFVYFVFVSFRFVFVDFVSFRFVCVDFVSFRFYFVSHFIGTQKRRVKKNSTKTIGVNMMFYFMQQTWATLLKPISCSKKEITLHLLYATTLNNYVNQSYVKDTCYHIEIVTDEYFKYFFFYDECWYQVLQYNHLKVILQNWNNGGTNDIICLTCVIRLMIS